MEIIMTSFKTSPLWVGSQYRDMRIGYGNYHDDKFAKMIFVNGVTIQGHKDRIWKSS